MGLLEADGAHSCWSLELAILQMCLPACISFLLSIQKHPVPEVCMTLAIASTSLPVPPPPPPPPPSALQPNTKIKVEHWECILWGDNGNGEGPSGCYFANACQAILTEVQMYAQAHMLGSSKVQYATKPDWSTTPSLSLMLSKICS